MKNSKYVLILTSFFLISISFISCEKENDELLNDEEIVRGAVKLTKEYVPILKEWPKIMVSGYPFVYYKGLDDFIVKYSYKWIRTSDGSSVIGELSADFVVTESEERALEYVEESREYNYSYSMCMDEPTITGDYSYLCSINN